MKKISTVILAAFAGTAAFGSESARVSDWGFDPADSTDYLQAALTSGVRRLVIDRQPSPWVTRPLFGGSNIEIVIEPGVEVVAKRGEFRGKRDSLFTFSGARNVTISGRGAALRMWREDYLKPPYEVAEWRTALNFLSCSNVTVTGLKVIGSGGDGLYLGVERKLREPCRDITVRDVVFDGNARQGVSVISVDGFLAENCEFLNTAGRPPQSGIDFEPNQACQQMNGVLMRNCRFANNCGDGITIAFQHFRGSTVPVDLRFENCRTEGNRQSLRINQRSQRGDFVKGRIDFSDCAFIGARASGLLFTQKPGESFPVSFRNCRIEGAGADAPEDFADVGFASRQRTDPPPDGFLFDNLTIVQPVARRAFDFGWAGWTHDPVTDIRGTATVVSPAGTRKIELDADWCARFAPPSKIAGGRGVYHPSAADVKDSAPGKMMPLAHFAVRNEASYLFYADSARTVNIVANMRIVKDRKVKDKKFQGLTLKSLDGVVLKKIRKWRGQKELALAVPKAGFYLLEFNVPYASFAPSSADVPLALALNRELPCNLFRSRGTLKFRVPEGGSSKLFVSGEGTSERVRITLVDPSGATVADVDNILRLTSFDATKPGLWAWRFDRPSKDRLEDVTIDFAGEAPYLFLSKERTW